jgi:hypothetical protein
MTYRKKKSVEQITEARLDDPIVTPGTSDDEADEGDDSSEEVDL